MAIKNMDDPPPRQDYSRKMSREDYAELIKDVEFDKYNRWRAKNKIHERGIVTNNKKK